jgi:hypothetical protein
MGLRNVKCIPHGSRPIIDRPTGAIIDARRGGWHFPAAEATMTGLLRRSLP